MGYKYLISDKNKRLIEEKISDITITLSSEDWLHIPDVNVEDHYITLPADAKRKAKALEKELFLELDNDKAIVVVNAAVLMGKLLQLVGGQIYDEEKEVVHIHDEKLNMLEKLDKRIKQPKLVIYNYKHERDAILKRFPHAVQFEEELLDKWNARKIPMLVANAQSIGHGLNLQEGSSDLIWYSLTWSRELYDQTNARLARQGQKERTTIHRILAKDSVDDAVTEALREKGDNQTGLLNALKNLESLRKG